MNLYFNKNFSSIELFFRDIIQYNPSINIFYSHYDPKISSEFAAMGKEPETIDDYISFCQSKKIDVFYPWHNIGLIIENKQLFENIGVKLIIPVNDVNLFDVINNKTKFYEYISDIASEIIPLYSSVNTKNKLISEYKALTEKVNNVCMKPSTGVYAAGFKKIYNHENKPNYFVDHIMTGRDKYSIHFDFLKNIVPDAFDELMLLEFIDGDEFSFDAFCSEGEIVFGVTRQKHKKTSKYQTLIEHQEIEKYSKIIAKKLNLNGFNNFQFMQDEKTGKLIILEINPRMSGGISKCNFSNINYSELFIDFLNNKPMDLKLKSITLNKKICSKTKYVILD